MIRFRDWKLTGSIDACQADHKTIVFTVTGLPKEYFKWELIWVFGSYVDILPLTLNAEGDIASRVFERENLPFAGFYTAQLRGHNRAGGTRHTDEIVIKVGGTYSEDVKFPTLPNSFAAYMDALNRHEGNIENPHKTTAAQVGARPDTWTPSASDVGAVPEAGGDVNGYLNFRDTNAGLSWKTADGTIIHLRPWSPDNVLQITMQNPTNGVSEFGAVNIKTDGTWGFSHAANVRKAIGAAPEDIYQFLPLSATTEYGRLITDALNINLVNPLGTQNKPGYVYAGGTSSLPAGFNNGIREVYYYSSEWVIIKLTGWDNSGCRPCVVYNTYRGHGVGWLGWEWENPPMVFGSEYRTTNRWMGKVVYKKLIDFGTLPNSTTKNLSLNMASYQVIKLEMQATNGNETFCEIGGHAYSGTIFVYDGKLQVRTTSDLSSFNAYITVWYTKD